MWALLGWGVDSGELQTLGQSETETQLGSREERTQWKWIAGKQWRRRWHPTPVLLPGKSHGRRSLVGCSPWGRKDWTRLSDFTFTFMHGRRKWQPTPVFLPGNPRDRGAWWAAVFGVAQSQTQLKRLSSSSSNRHFVMLLVRTFWDKNDAGVSWESGSLDAGRLVLSAPCQRAQSSGSPAHRAQAGVCAYRFLGPKPAPAPALLVGLSAE